MGWSRAERAAELGALVGSTIDTSEVNEVAERFESLVRELEKLRSLNLSGIQPITVFPETRDDEE